MHHAYSNEILLETLLAGVYFNEKEVSGRNDFPVRLKELAEATASGALRASWR